jgi:hypothetical protein
MWYVHCISMKLLQKVSVFISIVYVFNQWAALNQFPHKLIVVETAKYNNLRLLNALVCESPDNDTNYSINNYESTSI